MTFEPCPGCGALYPPDSGPTHAYIGASSGCWALFSALAAGQRPDAALVGASRTGAPPAVTPEFPREGRGVFEPLLVDAYAAQHPGVEGPQAIQSVAVHLLVLHAVLVRSVTTESALWVRRRALRTPGVFSWLAPGDRPPALTVRHLCGGSGAGPVSVADYVRSVYAGWDARHGETLAAWYVDYVLGD